MSRVEQYPAETYVDVLRRLASAASSPRRDVHYVEVLAEFLAEYPNEALVFLGVNGEGRTAALQY